MSNDKTPFSSNAGFEPPEPEWDAPLPSSGQKPRHQQPVHPEEEVFGDRFRSPWDQKDMGEASFKADLSEPAQPSMLVIPAKHMNDEELLRAYGEICRELPRSLIDINIQEEAIMQYITLRALLTQVLQDTQTQANQKAQVANSTAAALAQLDKIQKESYSYERFKQIENSLVAWLESMPKEQAQTFFDEYKRRLGDG